MTPIQALTSLQLLVIWSGTIMCYNATRLDGGKEKKYLLPYCIINSLVMIPLTLTEFMGIPIKLTYLVMFFFACIEITLIPYYIASTIGKKKNILLEISMCFLGYFLSKFILKSTTTILYLICNIYITIYVCRYFIWLFSTNERLLLKNTPHYWIIMGICICYTGSIPYFISELFILKLGGFEAYNKIVDIAFLTYIVLNISMYILFIKSFRCKINLQRSLSGQL